MSLKTYLVGIGISTFLCWAAFFLTVTNIDPFTADSIGIVSFFVSFFLGLLGLLIMVMMYLHSRMSSVAELYERMPILVRQALLIAFGLTALLGMQSMRVMRWWTAAMLLIILALVEISFYADRLDFEGMLEGESVLKAKSQKLKFSDRVSRIKNGVTGAKNQAFIFSKKTKDKMMALVDSLKKRFGLKKDKKE